MMPSFEKSEAYFRAKLDDRTKMLGRFLALHLPEQVEKDRIAKQVLRIFATAMGYCGEHLADAMKEWLLRSLRRESGFCLTCDNRLDSARTYPPLCKSCELAGAMQDVETEDAQMEHEIERDLERQWGPSWREKLDDESHDDVDDESP